MAQEVLDWTFAEIPSEDAPEAVAIVTKIRAPARPPRLRAQPTHWRWPRVTGRGKVALVLAGLLAGLGVMLLGAGQAGWRRIEQQVTAAVLYEESQARAGQVDAVLAAQVHTDGLWLNERALEVAQNQPAPLPAPQLHLLPGAPAISNMTAAYIDQATATVVRTYADAAGRTYPFEWVQTYVSRQPGIWLRQPTEVEAMQHTTVWAGQRLTVTFPLADQTWMSATLPLIDSDVEMACARLGCAERAVVPVAFSNRLPLPPSTAGQIVLLSPHLSGWPHDAAASQALREAVTARVLLFLAVQAAPDDLDWQARWLTTAEAALGRPAGLIEAVEAVRVLGRP